MLLSLALETDLSVNIIYMYAHIYLCQEYMHIYKHIQYMYRHIHTWCVCMCILHAHFVLKPTNMHVHFVLSQPTTKNVIIWVSNEEWCLKFIGGARSLYHSHLKFLLVVVAVKRSLAEPASWVCELCSCSGPHA